MRRIAVGIVGLLLVVGTAAGAGAGVAPSARVSPGGALRDGRQVTVGWRGMLSPHKGRTSQFLQVAECSRDFTPANATEDTYVQYCDEYYAQMSTHRGFWEGEVHVSHVGHADVPCTADACEIAVIAGHDSSPGHLAIEKVAIAPIEFRS
jgi:hypothetical protein